MQVGEYFTRVVGDASQRIFHWSCGRCKSENIPLELWEMQVREYSTRAVGDASQRIFH